MNQIFQRGFVLFHSTPDMRILHPTNIHSKKSVGHYQQVSTRYRRCSRNSLPGLHGMIEIQNSIYGGSNNNRMLQCIAHQEKFRFSCIQKYFRYQILKYPRKRLLGNHCQRIRDTRPDHQRPHHHQHLSEYLNNLSYQEWHLMRYQDIHRRNQRRHHYLNP